MDCVGSGGMNLACVGKRESSVNVEFPGKKQQNEWKTGNFERKQERKYLHYNNNEVSRSTIYAFIYLCGAVVHIRRHIKLNLFIMSPTINI